MCRPNFRRMSDKPARRQAIDTGLEPKDRQKKPHSEYILWVLLVFYGVFY